MAIKRDKILKNAEKLVQKGKLDQAIREYEKLLQASPNDTNTVNRLGDLYGRVGEIDKAVSLYEQVAEGFAGQGFIPKAIAIYKKINRLAPQRLDIFERLGDLYVEQGLMVEAKSQFQMLAEHYAKNDDMESAVRAHERLGAIDPNDSTSRLRFADMLLEAGNAEEGMKAYGALGETLIRGNHLDEAERLFRRLLDRELPDGDIMVPICDRLLDSGRVTSAQELLTAGLAVSPESVALRTLQIRAFMSLGESDSAVGLAREVLEVDPDNSEVRRLVGTVMMSDGDEAEATEMMIPAAEALLEKADYSRAQKMLRELVEIAPMDERILRLAIRAFRPSGDQEILTRLTASLADVCFSNDQKDQAKRFYLELVATDPTNALYRERLAMLDGAVPETADGIQTAGFGNEPPSEITFTIDEDEIEGEMKSAFEAGPATTQDSLSFDPTERINEAAVFAKYGLNEKAVKHLEEVVDCLPDHDEAREALAKMYLAVGERDRASKTIAPVIEKRRADGDQSAAEELERRFGAPSSVVVEEEDDDEIIILEIDADEEVEIDADEESERGTEEPPPEVIDFSDVNVDDMVAKAMGDLDFSGRSRSAKDSASATDALLADVLGTQAHGGRTRAPESAVSGKDPVAEAPFDEAPVDEHPVEDELVEEELVEISAGEDGPSSNALAQLDLFIDQELFEDAVGILERLESEYPGDSDLAQRREKLEGLGAMSQPAGADQGGGDTGVVELDDVADLTDRAEPADVRSPGEVSRQAAAVEPVQSPDDIFGAEDPDEYIDLAKELEEELAEEEAMVEEATGRGKGEALLDEVFREFQKGVAEQLSDEDSDTHFNLGIAYKEMGLLEEAVGEFRIASHDPAFFVEACSMIGVCATELGRYDEAAEWYQKALVAPDLSLDARTALRYELAAAFEQTGKLQEAMSLFEEIRTIDPAYRDVGNRLAALTQQRQVN